MLCANVLGKVPWTTRVICAACAPRGEGAFGVLPHVITVLLHRGQRPLIHAVLV